MVVGTPRVSATSITQWPVGTIVRVVGRVQNINGDTVTLETDSNNTRFINVHKKPESDYRGGQFYEVVGVTNVDVSVNEQIVYDWGNSFGMLFHAH
jgi:hypothetical protein